MQFRHILVPIDFSESANVGLDYALLLARQFEAKVTLLHVVELPTYVYATDILIPIDEIQRAAAKCIKKAAARAREVWPNVEPLLAEGTVWEQILSVASYPSVELVVMGTHGRRGISRALLGSVAEKVVRLSPVPVLTVRPREPKKDD